MMVMPCAEETVNGGDKLSLITRGVALSCLLKVITGTARLQYSQRGLGIGHGSSARLTGSMPVELALATANSAKIAGAILPMRSALCCWLSCQLSGLGLLTTL